MDLQRHDWRVRVAIAVVFGKHSDGFLTSIFHDQPARSLGKEQDESHDNAGHGSLNTVYLLVPDACSFVGRLTQLESSRPMRSPESEDLSRTISHVRRTLMFVLWRTYRSPPSEDITKPPKVVVKPCHCASVGRMSKFHGISRSSSAGNGGSKPEDETTSHELAHIVGGSLDCGANQHQKAADKDADSSTVTVCKKATKGEGRDLAEVIDNEDDSRATCEL